MLNKALLALCLIFSLSACKSPSRIRSSVVKLSSAHGSCSGTQIETKAGHKYILTAAHCRGIAIGDIMPVSTEDAGTYMSKVIAEDDASDLLLLEPAPNTPAIQIAEDIERFSVLTSYTHGQGFATYSTKGTFIGEDLIQADLFNINESNRDKCAGAKNAIEVTDLGFVQFEVCTLKVIESMTTVVVSPGSSGGLVANEAGDMVGVVSVGADTMSGLVTLKDIHKFVDNR